MARSQNSYDCDFFETHSTAESASKYGNMPPTLTRGVSYFKGG